MQNLLTYVRFILSLFLGLVLAGCHISNPTGDNLSASSSVQFQVTFLTEDKTEFFANIDRIQCILNSKNDLHREITQMFQSPKKVMNFGQLPIGYWEISITLFSPEGVPLYYTSKEVFIEEKVNNNLTLSLQPENGEISVVYAGTQAKQREYIYFYSAGDNMTPKIFRYSVSDSILRQITFNNRTTYPFYIPQLNKIGFSGYTTIEIMNPNGTDREALYTQPIAITHPSFAPTTNKIYFYTVADFPTRQIASINLNGTDPQLLFPRNEYQELGPDINTTGDSLLFMSDRSGTPNIFLLELQDLSLTQLTSTQAFSSAPNFSKQKNGFYYLEKDVSTGTRSIVYYSFIAKDNSTITSWDNFIVTPFALSPDESKLAFVDEVNAEHGVAKYRRLHFINIETGQVTKILQTRLRLGAPDWVRLNSPRKNSISQQ
ncbi:MAG: hypothetical protein K9N46_04670 [Candidatus Marinimicrobia bacterium]|nr:hypothetical protein [Candidatus Neomarinimicrobiota bacterium]MCF7829324.1 hypothetical protein [Candidatus Neomarinimicrobiota bacterium]MCF7880014.1 hypothetical protein [Candidatus Neomarinimicrobiota bacterium]